MALSLTTKTLKDGAGGSFTGEFATDGTNFWPVSVLVDSNGSIITDASGVPVSVQGTVSVSGTFWQATQPVSAVSLPLPSGAATAAKQPALGTAGTASTDVISVQGIASMTPLKVDGSAVTQPISGSVSQSGTWTVQPGNTANTTAWKVDGSAVTQPISAASLPLPTGAATAALQPTAAAQGSTTSGQTGLLMEAAVTTAAPTYTSGQTSPFSLDTAGNLRVNVTTGGVSGNVGQSSTTSGETGPMIQGAVTTSAPSYTSGQTNPVSLTPAGALRVDGSAVTQPVSGTVTANLGTINGAATAAKQPALGTAGTPSADVITVQGVTSMTPMKVDGSAVTQPVSGTFWQATQPISGSVTALNSGAITNPSSTLTRPSGAVSSSVTATSASPCVFTWTANPLANGQPIVLGGTAVPAGFTAGVVYFVVAQATNTFELAATVGGAAINSTSTGTSVTATITYAPNTLIASSASSPAVLSFAIATSAGGVILPRVRLTTNATSGWSGVSLSVSLWSAAPTYTGGDLQPYGANGAANWLANFQMAMTQLNDGAVGSGGLTGANQVALKLASGTSVFWDLQALSQAAPIASQTFTLVPELLN